ncbi:beta-glycosidase [Bacteroides thetaiotaomicron]|nr:glycoside hydrolase family 30 beta sandwich domain-containing protein [Bacteroides thetaiotaomicron]MDC2161685.1 beta-glycosidase [Bacteroides thetaiotaomicron]
MAQTFEHFSSTDSLRWKKENNVKLTNKAIGEIVTTDAANPIVTFRNWGTTFNEQDWKALCMLTREEQDEILQNVFAPNGQLRLTNGRISMNANDYALDWFSCSDVQGDFDLKYFNIERDKLTIIPYIRAAQKYNPDMSFWMSPWSPPAWMKINNHYAVQSSKHNDLNPKLDHLLYGDGDRSDNEQVNPNKRLFPRRLAVQDYFIQDPRYLQSYANMFSRFIDLYGEQGVPISMVMYQNEAYSYTPYPGCPWTSEGILRFNLEYLSPTLKEKHPEVELFLGTFNTNRYDHVKELLSDSRMPNNIKGVGFQWEGGQILPRIRKEYPNYRYIQTESECGNGSMNWRAGEHTFHLINHYIGNGCSEYYNWNLILCDRGESPWGWKQNALIRVNSANRTFEYVPEYYCYRHYSQFIKKGTKIIGFQPTGANKTPVLVALTPEGKYVIVAGNLQDQPQPLSVKIGEKYLNATLEPHSFHTFVTK